MPAKKKAMPEHVRALLSALEKSHKLLNNNRVSRFDLMNLHESAKQALLEIAPQYANEPYWKVFFKL